MNSLFKIFKVPSSDATRAFYANLVSGEAKRGLWGKEKRFDPFKPGNTSNIDQHFMANVQAYVAASDSVLDLGCGPGVFLLRLAGICGQVVGADITKRFVEMARDAIEKRGLENATAVEIDGKRLDFANARFDKILLVDVIHHLENSEQVLAEAHRVLKPGGKLLIFEPNKLNPALFLMCVLDRNEWGLLSLGTRSAYETVLASRFTVEHFSFCGLLIGPDSRLAFAIANFLLAPPWGRVLRFLSPKIFIVAGKI